MINLALTDFSVYSYNSYTHTSCNVLLVVKEGTKTKSICAEGVRENSVYTSKGSQLEIRIVENKKNKFESHFLIEYQGTKKVHKFQSAIKSFVHAVWRSSMKKKIRRKILDL